MCRLFIYIMLLIDLCFFYLIPMPGLFKSIINNYQKIGLSIFVILLIIVICKKVFRNQRYLFLREIFIFTIIVLAEIILSYLKYGQSIKSLVASSNQYFIIMAYFIMEYYLLNISDRIEDLEIIIIKVVSILSSILMFQYIIYSFTGILFLSIDKVRAVSSIRFGSIRIYEGGYMPIFGIVLTLGILLRNNVSTKVRKWSLFCVTISFLHLLLICKGRMGLVMIVLSCGFMILKFYNKNKMKKYLSIFIFIIFIFIIAKAPIVNNFVTSINSNDYSLITRVEAMEYYSNQIKENIFWGTGFIEPIKGDESFFLVRGPKGMYYKDDMGLLGFVNIFGVIGLAWFLILGAKIFKILISISRSGKEKECIEIYGVVFLVFVGSLVMSPFDSQRIMTFPILLALVEYAYRKIYYEDIV